MAIMCLDNCILAMSHSQTFLTVSVSRFSVIINVLALGLRASGNLPVSYVLTGNLPEIYHTIFFLSFRSI